MRTSNLKNRALTIIIAIAISTMLPAWCWAETGVQQHVSFTAVYDNPLTPDVQHKSSGSKRLAASSNVPMCNSIDEAAQIIRSGMAKRQRSMEFRYKFGAYSVESELQQFDVDVMEKAFEYNGVPTEGDYLRWTYGECLRNAEGELEGNYYNLLMTYEFVYYTTAEQEDQVGDGIKAIVKSLDISKVGDYEKAKSIYDYITENIEYDDEGLNNNDINVFTAYGAITNHKAVCQGYALLLYRMLLEQGIDCRLVAADNGYNSAEMGHAWNLIMMNGEYYYADSTWDAELIHGETDGMAAQGSSDEPISYFLKGRTDFKNHQMFTHYYDYIQSVPVAEKAYEMTAKDAKQSVRPTKLSSVTAGKKQLKAKWNKKSIGVDGYEIQCGTSSKFTKGSTKSYKVNNFKTASKKVTKLKSGKKYYVRVRSFRKLGGKTYYSAWSASKTAKVK